MGVLQTLVVFKFSFGVWTQLLEEYHFVVVKHLHSTPDKWNVILFYNVLMFSFLAANERKTVSEPVRRTEGNKLFFRKKEKLDSCFAILEPI